MSSRDFCFWLQGLFELGKPVTLDAEQTAAIKRHLSMVFLHEIDPAMGDAAHQAKLDDAHKPPSASGTAPAKPVVPQYFTEPQPHGEILMRC